FTLPLLLFCRTPPALSVLYTLSLHDALPIFTMSQLSICLIICLLTVISYVWGYFSLATTAIISMFLFMVTGCIDANTALGYFGNANGIMMMAMFVVAAGFSKTQFVKNVSSSITHIAKGSLTKIMAGYILIAVLLAQFIQSSVVV